MELDLTVYSDEELSSRALEYAGLLNEARALKTAHLGVFKVADNFFQQLTAEIERRGIHPN